MVTNQIFGPSPCSCAEPTLSTGDVSKTASGWLGISLHSGGKEDLAAIVSIRSFRRRRHCSFRRDADTEQFRSNLISLNLSYSLSAFRAARRLGPASTPKAITAVQHKQCWRTRAKKFLGSIPSRAVSAVASLPHLCTVCTCRLLGSERTNGFRKDNCSNGCNLLAVILESGVPGIFPLTSLPTATEWRETPANSKVLAGLC